MSDSKDQVVDDAIVKLIESSKSIIGDGQVNLVNILSIIISFMQIVEKMPNMKGLQKKTAVMTAVSTIIKNTTSDSALLDLVPSFIDIVIGVENNGLIFEPEAVAKSCWSYLSSCGGCFQGCSCACCAKKPVEPAKVEMK